MSVESPIASTDNWFIGEDRIFEFTVKNAAGAVQDISGWTIQWDMRPFAGSSTVLLTKSTPSGINITDGPNGVCQIAIARADTIDALGVVLIAPGRYVYALHRTDAGAATELAYGDAVLLEAASR